MFTITTATGKTFDSDYAVEVSSIPIGFIRIINSDIETVERVFSDSKEFPIKEYPRYSSVSDFINENTAVKMVLQP